jgi:hypothetical protein
MNQGNPRTGTTMANLHLNPPQAAAVPAGPKPRSRHAAITHDLYSYRSYKHWMNNLRPSRDKISRDTEARATPDVLSACSSP